MITVGGNVAINVKDYPNKIETGLSANNNFTVFFYRFEHERKAYRGLIDLSDKASWGKKDRVTYAKGELVQIKNSRRDSVLSSSLTLDALMDQYIAMKPDNDYYKNRKSFYDRNVSPHIGKKKVTELRQIHIQSVLKIQEDMNLRPSTIKQTLELLSPAIKIAIANRLISFNPLDGITVKLPPTKKMVVNASDKLKEIHAAIYAEFDNDPYYLALYLFALQGRRRGEILKMRWEDINFEMNYYVLRNTKNGEEQKIYLPDAIKMELEKFRIDKGWVFTSRKTGKNQVNIKKVTDRLKKRLNDPKFGVHYLRNVMVSAMAERGLESMHLSGALGHNDPNTIKKYLTMNYLRSSEMASDVIDAIVEKK